MSNQLATDLPEGWSSTTLGQVSECILGGTPSTEVRQFWGGDVPWMASGDVHLRRITDVPGRITTLGLRSSNATLTNPPAVAVGLAGQGKTRGTVAVTLCALSTNQSIALLKANGSDLRTDYLFHNLDRRYEELRARSSGGGRGGLSKAILEAVPIELPPLSEQQKVAQILDTLDIAIDETEAIIAKLKAVKQGLLQDVLTCGIGANGELRPPQAEAPHLYKESPLGWIPKEWDAVRLAALVLSIGQGWSPDCDSLPADSGSWGVLKTTAITWAGYSDQESKALPPIFKARPDLEVKAEDILITRAGPASRVGVVAYVESSRKKLMISDKMYRLRTLSTEIPAYIALALSSRVVQTELGRALSGMAESQTNISQAIVKDLIVLRPPFEEQSAIVDRVRASDGRIRAEDESLEKLKAFKAGLMDDLLTGRVRVIPLLAEAVQQQGGT
ncbi:type I restriction enzyme S subunit [Duganella sp. 1224]|uniref:restriction endonuclease subunit S n=1 Tax=Duganella sp. 1224 TaxID=2587052 RepID=UPI0015C79C90|nr:restriction endonuclease subunit S [Duganella sp. 1224]NYE61096.1 type I restriction enzyme S subunit [Duganella sp. 1224]